MRLKIYKWRGVVFCPFADGDRDVDRCLKCSHFKGEYGSELECRWDEYMEELENETEAID